MPAGRILSDGLAILFVYLCTHREAGQARPEGWYGDGPAAPAHDSHERARGVPCPETEAAAVRDRERPWFFSIHEGHGVRADLRCGRRACCSGSSSNPIGHDNPRLPPAVLQGVDLAIVP